MTHPLSNLRRLEILPLVFTLKYPILRPSNDNDEYIPEVTISVRCDAYTEFCFFQYRVRDHTVTVNEPGDWWVLVPRSIAEIERRLEAERLRVRELAKAKWQEKYDAYLRRLAVDAEQKATERERKERMAAQAKIAVQHALTEDPLNGCP